MALTSPTVTQIPKPATTSFAETMKQHRTWLDANKIQPASFRPVYINGVIGFEIGFRNEHEAGLFDNEFG
jgi:hypothetical protein